MAAALTLTIPVSIYAAEDDNQTIQSQTVDIEVDKNGWRIYDKQDYTFPESFWGVPVTRIAEGACNNKFTGSAIHVLKHAASFRILHYQTACNILETTHSTTL